jgi:hypothetical protein
MKRVILGVAVLLLPLGAFARSDATACKPCGSWQLDASASDDVEKLLDAAMAKYKPPRPRRMRELRGDVNAETQVEFENSLIDRPGPADRQHLREDLARLLRSPASLQLRQEGDDVVIEGQGTGVRRITPGEPHARVDALGTAQIASRLSGPTLTITESYVRKTRNREIYAFDAAKGVLRVTRTAVRPGLPEVVVHTTYLMH